MSEPRRQRFEEFLSMGQRETQAELLEVNQKRSKLTIGIPKESILQENRVALVPSGVASLVRAGHKVIVESGAGEKSSFQDHDYSEYGAEIVAGKKEVFTADCLLKVAPPTLDEIDLLHADQLLISPLQLPILTQDHLNRLKEKRVISMAMEYMQDENGSFPVVRIMSEMAGISAVLTAAELLSNRSGGNGILLGGISGVPPAEVVILGSGVVAEYAVRSALGLGAVVKVFDDNIYKLMRLQTLVNTRLFTSSFNPISLEKALLTADVAIGAIHSKAGRTPVVVSEDLVRKMKAGSVIVDISIDQGGCFATSKVTTHSKPTFVEYDVIHYCVPNISSGISRTASIAVSNILTPILLNAGEVLSIESLLYNHYGLRHGIYTYKGCLTNKYLAKRYQLKYTNLDLLLTSNI